MNLHAPAVAALLARRKKLKLSQRDAARRVGISFVHLCNVEKGHAEPSWEMLGKIADALGCDVRVTIKERKAGDA